MPNDPIERLRDRGPVAILSLSAEGAVTGCTQVAERFLGTSLEQIQGATFATLAQNPAAVERALGELRHSQSTHTICLTLPIGNKNGHEPAFVCVDALREQAGEVDGFLVTLRDARSVAFEPAPAESGARLAVPDPEALRGLTPRQRTVLEMIARGYSTREIAKRLNRSVKTIETHRAQLMKRLNIYHVPGLVGFAIRAGLVTVE